MPLSSLQRGLVLFSLFFSGSAIYGLPYRFPSQFRPMIIDSFGISNTQIGMVMSVLGVVALLGYFPGGVLADRYSARSLMILSLVSTALGGFYFTTLPGFIPLVCLWGYWGLTTCMLFWGALIRSTREWGGPFAQGQAFGILEAGRGLMAALTAEITLMIYQWTADSSNMDGTTHGLRSVILVYAVIPLIAAVLVWWLLPGPSHPSISHNKTDSGSVQAISLRSHTFEWSQLSRVLRMPTIWLQATIVISAYSVYRGSDNYSLFAVDAYQMSALEGARVTGVFFWMRPLAAVTAGLLVDYIRPSRFIFWNFLILFCCHICLGWLVPDPNRVWMLWLQIIPTSTAIFALRGIYFTLLEEGAVPLHITGTAVGLISLIGFAPDIFVPPITGWLIDRNPGTAGHQHVFMLLTVFTLVGLVASFLFGLLQNANPGKQRFHKS